MDIVIELNSYLIFFNGSTDSAFFLSAVGQVF